MSYDEWNYLLNSRPDASAKNGIAKVNGVNGLVLLPDNWILPSGLQFTSGFANSINSDYYETVNTYTSSEWETMESAGAVFLPAAGIRHFEDIANVGNYGNYWSSSEYGTNNALNIYFNSNEVSKGEYGRYYGRSVRLCSEL